MRSKTNLLVPYCLLSSNLPGAVSSLVQICLLGGHPPRTRQCIPPATTSTPKWPPGPDPTRDSNWTRTTSRCRCRTPTWRIQGGRGTPPPPQYQAAPRRAPKDQPTPIDRHYSSDEARSRKHRRSSLPPAQRTRPRPSRSPHRHRPSTTHSRRSRSPRRHHDPPGAPLPRLLLPQAPPSALPPPHDHHPLPPRAPAGFSFPPPPVCDPHP